MPSFENTSFDFADCLYTLKYESDIISSNEKEWAKRLYEQAKEYIEVYKNKFEEEE